MNNYKLGSLFDGSGGFPLAGVLCGIEPMWAAEVEPYPIAVTRSRFPNMKHLGDISKVNGGEIEPVDIITFGSPCQDLSVAGKRAGLKHADNGDEETTRSGLFMEAVRIIKEMRNATNGEYPRFALWENVPGAFSSNLGNDFRVVCEELIKIVEPSASMPAVPQNGWNYADSFVGDGWSLAYRVLDAQYWGKTIRDRDSGTVRHLGTPQRRRRIYLITDFRGERAREILFEREGLRGYFATGRTPWQTAPADAQRSIAADDREGEGFDAGDGDGRGRQLDAVGLDLYNGAETGDKAATLTTQGGGTASGPSIAVPYTMKIRSGVAVDSSGKAAGKGALIQVNKAATLATSNDQYLFAPVTDQHILDDQGGSVINVRTDGKAPTLRAQMGGHPPVIMEPTLASGRDTTGCLMASGYEKLGAQEMFSGDYTVIEPTVYSFDSLASNSMKSSNPNSGCREVEVSKTLDTTDPNPSKNQGGMAIVQPIAFAQNQRDEVRDLGDKAGAVQAQPGMKQQTFIAEPTYCIQGSMIGREDKNGPQGSGINEGVAFTQNATDRHAVVTVGLNGEQISPTLISRMSSAVGTTQDNLIVTEGHPAMCCTTGSFTQVTEEQTPTLMARDYKDPTVVLTNYIVRRLTPTECARLQGFADRWGDIDPKNDFAEEEYKFWCEVYLTKQIIDGKVIVCEDGALYTKNGMKPYQHKTKVQMLAWYNKLQADSAEYKMWGNGIALPTALYCMQGIADVLASAAEDDSDDWMN